MAVQRELPGALGSRKFLVEEDGRFYRRHHQSAAPVLAHVEHLRHKVNEAPRSGNPNGWRHEGTVPIELVTGWCEAKGYTFDQWARNEGSQRGVPWWRGQGVKDQFMRYFKSREFSKLHNHHVTTKPGSSQIVVPDKYGVIDGYRELRRPEGRGQTLAE